MPNVATFLAGAGSGAIGAALFLGARALVRWLRRRASGARRLETLKDRSHLG
ncbi:hypothetical protein J421_4629 (plasmid) [Gemmatirosa kalamazoonensis]|uniref:Uncharacterized protein n=1 Tax=Gemmatirosa kalamazoonensis TaxID=861299 RepID=W0RMU0_9BACT|nr:hypothetical protein [Gemmatirosa kalamazoonensis]AHG92096.1 hypothetical protein J421_4561 [Gemmatirosa kalamazoonensis]AHG92164.1 hypothetical protein J421_4629 [Gemmatirosa kalamazoonensis]